jgi:hypothetical protein
MELKMRLTLLITSFLIPLFGLASFPIQKSIPYDTILDSKKETIEEYKIRIQKQLYKPTEKKSQNSSTINKTKRKNFVSGGGFSYYSELENNLLLNIGSILFDYLYVGCNLSKDYLLAETRLYSPTIDLYLCTKFGNGFSGRKIFKFGIGYDYFLNEAISINSNISFYKYEREWSKTTISYTGESSNDLFDILEGLNSNTTDYFESHIGHSITVGLQFHF